MKESQKSGLLSVQKAAELLGVHPTTLRRWEKSGEYDLTPLRTKGNQRRYKPEDIDKIKKEWEKN